MNRTEIRNWIVFGGASVLITGAAVILALGPGLRWATDTAVEALPIEFEKEVGLSFVDSVFIRDTQRDTARAAVLQRIAKLLPDAGDPREYSVHISRDTILNAFALPGGTIVITRGLLDRMQDESELFAVLGHEAGHVRHRHFLKRLARQMGLAAGIALVVGDASGFTGILAGVSRDLVQLGHGRRAEEESDDEGLATLRRLNLDPEGMIRLFEHLDEGSRADELTPDFISTHPSAERRIQRVREALAREPAGRVGRVLTDAEWALLKQHPAGTKQLPR